MAERGARLLLFFSCLTFLYTSLANAAKGSTVRNFTVFRFSVEPSDTLAVRGAPALLNCSAYSSAPVQVDWKKDGTFLNLAVDDRRQLLPDGSLLITSVVHSKHNKPDEGIYQCVATIDNLGTIKSRTARLIVAGLPRFSSQPEAVTVHEGDTEILSCEVNADLVPFTHWERNKQAVELDQRVVQLPNSDLVVSNASEADVGQYRCLIENLGPAKASEEAELKLEILQAPESVTKVLGERVLLPCVLKGNPPPIVRWTKGGIGYSLHLQIVNLTEEDAGIYSCLADNGNETIEATAELTVQVPPRFLKKPSNIYAHESMDIIFECDVTGSPPPTVKWLKNGDTVFPSDYFKIVNQHNLQVLGLVISDEGFYQCLAENEAGNIQASSQLIILDHKVTLLTPPVPSLTSTTTDHIASSSGESGGPTPSAPRDVVASLVSTRFIKLTWRIPAEPNGDNITYSVYYSLEGTNRERIENTSRPGEMQVTIQNLMPDTKYTFRVVAFNRNGQGESSAPLTVATQPEVQVPGPAPNLQAAVTSPTSITLSWNKPLTGNGEIQTYKLYYTEKGQDLEQDFDVTGLSHTMTGLKKFTEYSFRVVALNKHGPGVSTEDVAAQTLSDIPSAAPQNLTLEVRNSKSIMMKWQPPPPGTQNGEITGYKIRYRKGGRKGEAVEVLSTQHFQLIDNLERGTEYAFRVSATTVNGSGPATDWLTAETFESDLDESQVPEIPSSLHVRPLVNSIVVSWTPPENQDIVVRGYIIGYGKGSPHAQTIKVDYKQRYFTIDNLDPNSHYVITLKAFNNVGEGVPIYESATTRMQSDPIDPDVDLFELFHTPYTPVPDPTPMLPPVGVQASVISHDTVKVTWADNSLPKNQKITDARFYTVRWKTNIPANTKFKTANTTTLSHMVSGLKPNTLYEFSVMVTKGRRMSTWSMTAHVTTLESIPSSPPKDVTVVSKEGRPRTININWQPPSEANGKITGYIIYYSTDVNAEVHDWVVEPVVGNRLTHQIQELTLDTVYYFKIQARNSKGMGPMSEAVEFRTPKGERAKWPINNQQILTGSHENHMLVIVIIVAVGAFTIIVVVVGAFLCTRRTTSHQKKKRAACKSTNGSHKYKGTSKDLKPPDLWIHHERLELKPMDKSPEPNPVMTDTPIPRSSQDVVVAESATDNPMAQRRNSYRGHETEDVSTLAGRRGVRPKMMMPFDAQPPQPVISAHPIHSLDNHHHHYHMSGLSSLPRSYLQHQFSLRAQASALSQRDGGSAGGETEGPPSYNPPTAHVRPTHPLKSFAVPAIPRQTHDVLSAHVEPFWPIFVVPAHCSQLHSVKTASIGTLGRTRTPMAVTVPSAPDAAETSKMLEDTQPCYETDELSEEMAHLEGLMKDLNAITNP
uniref:Neogenin n=1 Tax=Denticeps clupeoides TaxID=299321 RepID=A0AAY4E3W9_9TELE